MHLDLRGHPLHTRSLSVTLTQRADGRLDAHAEVVDLRKRGFVPVAGELQPSGVVHHMLLDGEIDPRTAVLDAIALRQPSVAFEATAVTGGESCRDPADRIQGLGHLLGSTVAWALARDRERFGEQPGRRPGERVLRRDVVVDGAESDDRNILLGLQLTELHYAPAPAIARPMDRFGASLEIRGLATVDLGRYAFGPVQLAERWRTTADPNAAWRDRADVAARLPGVSLMRGVSTALRECLGESPADRPLQDGLLMLAPTLIQVFAALSPDGWSERALREGWLVGLGGQPDSCWMWRRGGPLESARRPEDPNVH